MKMDGPLKNKTICYNTCEVERGMLINGMWAHSYYSTMTHTATNPPMITSYIKKGGKCYASAMIKRHLLYFFNKRKVAISSYLGMIKWIFQPLGRVVLLKPFLCFEESSPPVASFSFQLIASLVFYFLRTRLKMVCLCWLLVVVMAYVCVPGFGSVCWDNSICNDLSNKEQILVGQAAFSIIYIVAFFLFLLCYCHH